jgi:hypothetical protein
MGRELSLVSIEHNVGSVDLCNVLSFGLRAVRMSLAAKLSNNSKEELLCKN